MSCNPLDLPPAVASAFVKDVRACFAEENQAKRGAVAGAQDQNLASLFQTL